MSEIITRAGYMIGAGLLLLFLLVCAGAFWAVHATQTSSAWLTHTHDFLDNTKSLLIDTMEAEASHRGYLITGDAIYMQLYKGATGRITSTLSQLRQLTSDSPNQIRSVTTLSEAVRHKIEEQEERLKGPSNRTQEIAADRDDLTNIRFMLTAMAGEEDQVFKKRLAEMAVRQKVAHALIALGAVLAIALIGFGLWNLRNAENLRQRAEKALAATAAELAASFNSLSQGVAVFDGYQRLVRWNSGWLTFVNSAAERVHAGLKYSDLTDLVEPGLLETVEEVSKNSVSFEPFVSERTRADSEVFELRRTALPGGGFVLTSANITQRIRVAETAKETERLQAIGQLTGAVAHDFNNNLTIILGNLEIAQRKIADPQIGLRIGAAIEGAQRSAELTRQLLSFGRRQSLESTATDVNKLATGMRDLLRRSLPENIDVEVIEHPELWAAMVDPAHLENAILNLALNARDAMPGGGNLTIKTANVSLDRSVAGADPGKYVLIAIKDTGTGMSPEVLGHCFEPFYTTKGNNGTGLGLSSVYGFVNQSNGLIKISSSLDEGTTIYLYLPRADHRDLECHEQDKLARDEVDQAEEIYHMARYA